MSGREGRFIVRCLVTAIVAIVAVFAFADGIAALSVGGVERAAGRFVIVAICTIVAYGVREWERARLVDGVRSDIDLADLRDDVLTDLSEGDLALLQDILNDQAKREALRKMKR